jgi:hypothetical protein
MILTITGNFKIILFVIVVFVVGIHYINKKHK